MGYSTRKKDKMADNNKPTATEHMQEAGQQVKEQVAETGQNVGDKAGEALAGIAKTVEGAAQDVEQAADPDPEPTMADRSSRQRPTQQQASLTRLPMALDCSKQRPHHVKKK